MRHDIFYISSQVKLRLALSFLGLIRSFIEHRRTSQGIFLGVLPRGTAQKKCLLGLQYQSQSTTYNIPRLVFTSDGVGVGGVVGIIKELMT